jgi:nucleotide-binding universal stress UspA family protein
MIMTKTILVPLDGSPLSERAVPYAQVLARRLGARVLLVRAVLTGPSSTRHDAPPAELQEAQSELARTAMRFRDAGIEVDTVVPNDEGGWAVINTARDTAADLIVMSTHGRSGLTRSVYGSVADRVLRTAPAPVLLIPAAAAFNWPADSAAFRIVVPLDGSPLAEGALDRASALVEAGGGELILVRALLPPSIGAHTGHLTIPAGTFQTREAALEDLAPLTARLAEHGIRHTACIGEGIPADVIVGVARERHAHLIAMGTHGRGGLTRLALGSVADAVLRHTHVALLLVRPSVPVDQEREGAAQAAQT